MTLSSFRYSQRFTAINVLIPTKLQVANKYTSKEREGGGTHKKGLMQPFRPHTLKSGTQDNYISTTICICSTIVSCKCNLNVLEGTEVALEFISIHSICAITGAILETILFIAHRHSMHCNSAIVQLYLCYPSINKFVLKRSRTCHCHAKAKCLSLLKVTLGQ